VKLDKGRYNHLPLILYYFPDQSIEQKLQGEKEMLKLPHERRMGFTLVELLIVISIIVILMGLILPVASIVMRDARNAAAQSFLKNLEGACAMYALEFGIHPPIGPYIRQSGGSYSLMANVNVPAGWNWADFAYSRGAGPDKSAKMLYYYLGTTFRKNPDFSKGEAYSTKNVGPFMDFKSNQTEDLDGDGHLYIVDLWGNPIKYFNNSVRTAPNGTPTMPGAHNILNDFYAPPYDIPHNKSSVDLYSFGTDGEDDAGYNENNSVDEDFDGNPTIETLPGGGYLNSNNLLDDINNY